jgi:hypothetical protein
VRRKRKSRRLRPFVPRPRAPRGQGAALWVNSGAARWQRRGGLIRFTLRLVGLLLLAGAFAAAVIDGARSLADQKLELYSMGTVLAYAFPAKFALMHDYVVKKTPMAWNLVVVNVLYAPATLDLAVLGAVLFYLARRPSVPLGATWRRR